MFTLNLFVFSLPNGFSLDCLVVYTIIFEWGAVFALNFRIAIISTRFARKQRSEGDKIHCHEHSTDYTFRNLLVKSS